LGALRAKARGRDLLPKTRLVDATAVSTEWLEALPGSSMVIAARSANTDRAVASWQHDRASNCCESVLAAGGVGTFSILENR